MNELRTMTAFEGETMSATMSAIKTDVRKTLARTWAGWATGCLLAAAGVVGVAGVAGAQSGGQTAAQAVAGFPSRPVKFVVPYPAGGAGDLIARSLGAGLQNIWGKAVVIENQAGASGIIAVETGVRAQPDGTTMVLISTTQTTVLPFIMDKLPYDPLRDLAPVSIIGAIPNILVVSAKSPYKTLADLVAAAKAKPGALDYASSGKGQSHHMMMEYMMRATGSNLNAIPYKGGAPALVAVMGGEVQAAWIAVSTALPLLKNGQLRGLAMSTEERFAPVPDVLTVSEQGYPGFNYNFWMGITVSSKTPAAIVKKMDVDVKAIFDSEAYRDSIRKTGNLLRYEGNEQFTKTIRDEYARNKAILAP